MYLDQSFEIPLVNADKFHCNTWIFDDNSVCVATCQQNSTKIQHYNSKCLINEFIFNTSNYISGIAPISQHEIILLQKSIGRIEYLNLLTKQQRFISYNFKSQSIYNNQIISFLKSSFFCVYQDIQQKQGRKISLTYFDKNMNQISQYFFENSDRLSKKIVLNHSSNIGILKTKQTNIMKIEIVNSTSTSIFQAAFPTLGDYVIKEIFEISTNRLILFCESTTPHKLIEWNLEEKTMKPFLIDGIKQDHITNIFFGGDFIYFLMLQSNDNKNLLVVDQNTLKVIHRNIGFKDHYHQYKIQINKGRSRLVQFKIDRQKFTTVGVRLLEIVNQKELFLSILEQIGDFDEDMLRNIVNVIQYKKQ